MGDEAAFLNTIRAQPANETARLLYADWLEENGDVRSEFLRLECQLYDAKPTDAKDQELRPRLQELAPSFDLSWIGTVCRVPLDIGEMAIQSAHWSDPASPCTATMGGVKWLRNEHYTNRDELILDPVHAIALLVNDKSRERGTQDASVAADTLRRELVAGLANGESLEANIRRSIHAANLAVLARNAYPQVTERTTFGLAMLHAGRVFVSWVGDVMAFHISQHTSESLTWLHDFRTLFYRTQHFSEAEKAQHRICPHQMLYSLGEALPDPIEIPSFVPKPGDRLVLATHDVYHWIEPAEMLALCQTHTNPLVCAELLVRANLESVKKSVAARH